MSQLKTFRYTIAYAVVASLLAGCSSNDDDASSIASADQVSSNVGPADTVEVALSNFPNALLPIYALSNNEVTAAEVFRRVEFNAAGDANTSYGVEGASSDELLELEARFSENGDLLERVRNESLTELPEAINTAFLARFPGAIIEEIERSTTTDGSVYAILFDSAGEELEANFDQDAQFLFLEDVEERANIPANILAVADAQEITLPDFEFEVVTFANGTIEYAVEFENDDGQSITVAMDVSGNVLRIEHEDSLERLSVSDTVEEALAQYPAGIEAIFSTMFTEVTAAEIFRSTDLTDPSAPTEGFGIEGVSDDEQLEIEAIFSSNVVLQLQARGLIIQTLPDVVNTAFIAQFPGAQIEEIAETMDDDGTSYAVLFTDTTDEELEANYTDAGVFTSLEDVLEEDEIPAVILTAVGNDRVLLPIVEFEQVTAADGTISFVAEYENTTGDSISYAISSDGTVQSIEHETAL